MKVTLVDDFELDGTGKASEWRNCSWQRMAQVGGSTDYSYMTRAKALRSETGVYFLVDCADRCLHCTMQEDFANLFTEDVVEVFLWPAEKQHLYLEYEVSPLGYELPILVPNYLGTYFGWLPWQYQGTRRCRKAVHVRGGEQRPMATCEGWSVELFIPYALMTGMGNVPPSPGSTWRCNIYRIDYDDGSAKQWAWCKDTGANFHDFTNFGTLQF